MGFLFLKISQYGEVNDESWIKEIGANNLSEVRLGSNRWKIRDKGAKKRASSLVLVYFLS